MSPITHFLLSWGVANALPNSTRKDRALITFAGIAPDLDGLGVVAELLTRNSPKPLLWWSDYHHILGHNIAAAALITLIAAVCARDKLYTALLVAISFHLHLLCDVIGARGPDGYQWPIPYLLPFSNSMQWTWTHQWALNAWQNMAITAIAIFCTLALARRRGFSPLEFLSTRADLSVVNALRSRFPLRHRNP